MAILTTSEDDLKIITSMQENMAAHMLFLPERLPSCTVLRAQEIMMIDSHVEDSTFNLVLKAQLQEENASEVVDSTIAYFQREGLPFSWWVGPDDTPAELPHILEGAGLTETETNVGMSLTIEHYGYEQIELRIERVLETQQKEDYASIMIELHERDDAAQEWYHQFQDIELSLSDYEQFYVGYLDETPVCAGSVTLHSDVAGIYNLVTRPRYRRRGFATAMIQELLIRSQEAGYATAVLIAEKNAVSLYEKLGFERLCEFSVFEAIER